MAELSNKMHNFNNSPSENSINNNNNNGLNSINNGNSSLLMTKPSNLNYVSDGPVMDPGQSGKVNLTFKNFIFFEI
jgi:hypothetical protein